MSISGSDDTGPAHLQVMRGAPDDLELAALVAGLAAASERADDRDELAGRSAWNDRARAVRGRSMLASTGPDAWRWSLRS